MNSRVIKLEKNTDMIIIEAKVLAYSPLLFLQLRYQARPALTPSVSAAASVKNDAVSPTKSPRNTFGSADGIATRKMS